MIQAEECPVDKNISKTSQFIFGQNYKKLVANSKPNFDFRRFIQKHSNTKKHFATITPKDQVKRNPLEQVNSSESNTNQTNLQSKAFKIRCYSRKTQKQNSQQQQAVMSKLFRYKPRIFPMKQTRNQTVQKRSKTNIDFKKCIRMHKFDNFYELQSIANNIKVYYNNSVQEQDSKTDKAIVLDTHYLVGCMKAVATKVSEKDKELDYFRKKVVFMVKKIIEDKYFSVPQQKDFREDIPQLIFKTANEDQVTDLVKLFQECQFTMWYCVFSVQQKFVESVSTYMLTKIHNLAQNITIVDDVQNIMSHPPLLDSRHFVAFSTFSEKANFGLKLESLFHQNENLQIRFSAQEFENQEPVNGRLIEIVYKQLLEKVKQKRTLKQCKKSSRQKKQRCHSSYEDTNNTIPLTKHQQSNLQHFKQKMLKYLKIVGTETRPESKRSRQLSSENSEELECMTGRGKNSKTNNQVVSELIKLNSQVHKQISTFQRKVEQVSFDLTEQENDMVGYLRFDKVYVNSLD